MWDIQQDIAMQISHYVLHKYRYQFIMIEIVIRSYKLDNIVIISQYHTSLEICLASLIFYQQREAQTSLWREAFLERRRHFLQLDLSDLLCRMTRWCCSALPPSSRSRSSCACRAKDSGTACVSSRPLRMLR